MTFLTAWRLALLAAVAALAAAWLMTLRRGSRDVVRFTDVALLDVVAPDRSRWRRHVPAALWLVALALLVVGFARPARWIDVTRDRAVVIVALDVSPSMEAGDVAPDRSTAARQEATSFIEDLPSYVEVGLVLFSGTIETHPPTTDREALSRAIDGAALRESTAIGEAIYEGIDLVEAATRPDGSGDPGSGGDAPAGTGGTTGPGGTSGTPAPGRIVVLSDGATNAGRPDAEAARAAAGAGVAVDTIAFGTADGVVTTGGVTEPVPAAPGPLREVADVTGGTFHRAGSAGELAAAYGDIRTVLDRERERREIGAWFTGGGLLLLGAAGAASLAWNQRLP